MKVVLKNNVAGVGQKDDIKEVKPGFWRNFLLPRDLAVEATPQLIKLAQKRREEREKMREKETKKLAEVLKKIKNKVLKLKTRADEKGTLFEGINAEKISQEIKKQFKVEIPAGEIKLEKPIKKIGSYEVNIGENVLKIEVGS